MKLNVDKRGRRSQENQPWGGHRHFHRPCRGLWAINTVFAHREKQTCFYVLNGQRFQARITCGVCYSVLSNTSTWGESMV